MGPRCPEFQPREVQGPSLGFVLSPFLPKMRSGLSHSSVSPQPQQVELKEARKSTLEPGVTTSSLQPLPQRWSRGSWQAGWAEKPLPAQSIGNDPTFGDQYMAIPSCGLETGWGNNSPFLLKLQRHMVP